MGESRELNCCCFSTFIFIDRTLLDPGVRVRASVSSSPRSGSKGTESIDHGKLDDTRRSVHTWEQPSGEQRPSAQTASSVDAQYLIEKVIRARIYDSLYWKEHCFALNGAYYISCSFATAIVRSWREALMLSRIAHRPSDCAQGDRRSPRPTDAHGVHVPYAQAVTAAARAGNLDRVPAG